MKTVDLNSDLGESFGVWQMGNDAAMIDVATSVNVACGFHGGDYDTMRKTVELAKARGVSVGAHPGYRDIHGFGRRPFYGMKAAEIENLVAYQIGALQAIAALECRFEFSILAQVSESPCRFNFARIVDCFRRCDLLDALLRSLIALFCGPNDVLLCRIGGFILANPC